MTNQNKQNEDAAIAELAVFKEFNRRLLIQASAYTRAYNRWKLQMIAGIEEGLPELIDKAIAEYWKLEEIEAAVAPWHERGFPQVPYDRPNPYDTVHAEDTTESLWETWRAGGNVVKSNNQSGVVNGFDK